MTYILVELAIVLVGLAITAILFHRFPTLPAADTDTADYPSVSVIIPARNEEVNLPLLLSDLYAQTLPIHEIICVDDNSEDSTAQIIAAGGARLIALNTKPSEWTGKTWACQIGADAATGELLLFLDADVRLGPDGVRLLIAAYRQAGCTVPFSPIIRQKRCMNSFL